MQLKFKQNSRTLHQSIIVESSDFIGSMTLIQIKIDLLRKRIKSVPHPSNPEAFYTVTTQTDRYICNGYLYQKNERKSLPFVTLSYIRDVCQKEFFWSFISKFLTFEICFEIHCFLCSWIFLSNMLRTYLTPQQGRKLRCFKILLSNNWSFHWIKLFKWYELILEFNLLYHFISF